MEESLLTLTAGQQPRLPVEHEAQDQGHCPVGHSCWPGGDVIKTFFLRHLHSRQISLSVRSWQPFTIQPNFRR